MPRAADHRREGQRRGGEGKPTSRSGFSAPLQRKGAARFEGLKDFPGLNLRGPMTRAPPATTDIAPEGTRYIAGTFRSADGSRNYKLFVPSRSQEKPLPLAVMLHGCTQSPGSVDGRRLARAASPF
jgi:hypothetical protein